MAHKKKHTRRRHTHRRRVSGTGSAKGVLMKVAGVGAGIFAGRMLTTKLGATMNPKISGAVAILAGVFIPKYLKSELGQGIGDGLVAAGVLAELQSFNVLAGIGAAPPPGAFAQLNTGSNYNAKKAVTVGASPGRSFVKASVGGSSMNGFKELKMLGALMED